MLLSYAWLLKYSWSQSSAFARVSQENNQLRIRLFTATNLLAADRDVRAQAELSDEVLQKSRVIELLNQVIAHKNEKTSIAASPPPVAAPRPTDNQITTLQKSLDLLKTELLTCQQSAEKLKRELVEAKACETPVNKRIVTTAKPTVDELMREMDLLMGKQHHEEDVHVAPLPPKCVATFEFDKKRTGAVYSSSTASSANRCKRMCLADVDCQAWVFVQEENQCDLMLNSGSSIPNRCCVSGLRCGGGN